MHIEVDIAPAKPEDAPHIAHLHRLAFMRGQFLSNIMRGADPEDQEKRFAERMIRGMNNPECEVITARRRDGNKAIVGFAFMDRPRPWRREDPPHRTFANGVDQALANRVFDRIHAGEQAIKEQRYHVHTLATDITLQRSGVGKALLLYIQALAERDGVAIYLEALEEGIPVYEKMGYEAYEDDVTIEPGIWYRPMRWRKKPSESSGAEQPDAAKGVLAV